MFLAIFWAYVGQPDDHIGWATLMPFASIYRTNQRTNPWIFFKWELRELKISVRVKGWAIFKKKFFFASSPWKSVNIYRLPRMGRNFDDYPGFQPKITFLYYYLHDCMYFNVTPDLWGKKCNHPQYDLTPWRLTLNQGLESPIQKTWQQISEVQDVEICQ